MPSIRQGAAARRNATRVDLFLNAECGILTSESAERVSSDQSRILLVEDNDDSREVAKEYLEMCGYVVSEACDGISALELLDREPEPALVILDLDLPRMSGNELLAAMKECDRLARLPVLVVSGSAKCAVPIGGSVVGFLPKPVQWSAFSDRVRMCLDGEKPKPPSA
jgi:CheY-like chemotaxis protein